MEWNQYQANEAGTGFMPKRTRPAIAPSWTLSIGPTGFTSPVIGANGTIYIGTLNGQLLAIDPRGEIRWQKDLKIGYANSKVTGSPAVDEEGNVYVVDTYAREEADHRINETGYRLKIDSTLHCFDINGVKKWTYRFPRGADPHSRGAYTLSSPKLLTQPGIGTTIFTPMITVEGANQNHYLLAVNQDGVLLEKKQHASYPPEPITGSTDWGGVWDAVWDFISSPVDFDTSGLPTNGLSDRDEYLNAVGLPTPSVTIGKPGRNQSIPLIIFEDGVKTLAAYEWQTNDLNQKWVKTDNSFRRRSSPALLLDGTLAMGQHDGKVVIYNAEDGKPFYQPWVKAGERVVSPVASFGRQLYVAASNAFTVIDSGNSIYKREEFNGNTKALGAPALSANYCYLMTTHDLITYSFDAEENARVNDFPGGVSTPCIANDGSIYAVDFKGLLWAFNRPDPIVSRPIRQDQGVRKNQTR